ncbi:helicase RepA family protein [Yinghuangia sp. ASG 101]|uniref:AAA family ATPase n=1 Tax=Yinghuangia sp. ASG 101 TaxID=2896848 RepID=UPI001E49D08C|nr:AAA family ATPase [Yinghuangia sp. ASG 101]UGQ15026.1 helicase RepA family protein [Yinghuangia sp. ASG 101]
MNGPDDEEINERAREILDANGITDEQPGDQAGEARAAKVQAFLDKLLGTRDLGKIPPVRPLIADMLFLDSIGRMNGPSGHGKSFVSLGMSGCVGTGLLWHGRRVHQGPVVYIVAEGIHGVVKRVRAWEQAHGREMDNVWFLPEPVQIKSPEWDIVIEACARIQPVLIVLDTQARVTVGVEENSASEMGVVVHRLEALRAATGACVLLVHHKGLNGDHGRGSTAVKGAMQTEFSVEKKGDKARPQVILTTDKQKDTEEIAPLVFLARQIKLDGMAEEDGRPVTSLVLELDESGAVDTEKKQRLGPAKKKLLAALNALEIPEVQRVVIDKFAELHDHGLSRPKASEYLNDLARDGLIERIPAGGTVLWKIAEPGKRHVA